MTSNSDLRDRALRIIDLEETAKEAKAKADRATKAWKAKSK